MTNSAHLKTGAAEQPLRGPRKTENSTGTWVRSQHNRLQCVQQHTMSFGRMLQLYSCQRNAMDLPFERAVNTQGSQPCRSTS
jgi:hypothetical protein